MQETSSAVNKDSLVVDLYAIIVESYPDNIPQIYYFHDTKYVVAILFRHLRRTYLNDNALVRNTNLFKAFIKNAHYTSRCNWLQGMVNAIEYFFPLSTIKDVL